MAEFWFYDFVGPVAGIYCLVCVFNWLASPIPYTGPFYPWPGLFRASWRFNEGRRRATVIQQFPGAIARYWVATFRDWMKSAGPAKW